MRNLSVTIEKLVYGGAGLGHIDGKVCFVPYSAPGDQVRIKVKSEKRSYIEGELLDFLERSPSRVTPPCPVFGDCGGCNWQHISYDSQLAAKTEIFSELLWRSGRVSQEQIFPIVPAPEPYGYRSRIQFKVYYSGSQLHFGFYRPGSHFVVDVPRECVLAAPSINRLFSSLSSFMIEFPEPEKIPQIDVTVGDEGYAILVFHYLGEKIDYICNYLRASELCTPSGVYLQAGRKSTLLKVKGCDFLLYTIPRNFIHGVPEIRLTATAGVFSQVNYKQNLALIEKVYEFAELTGTERVLDIYCGNGNFSIPLSFKAAMVIGIEEYGPSIDSALHNCRVNNVSNASFYCCDAAKGLSDLAKTSQIFDVVLLDPPRTGAFQLLPHIPLVKPGKIIYVSCDPATLARDIGVLRKVGYSVVKSIPFDMFPQTYHMESVTLFEPEISQP